MTNLIFRIDSHYNDLTPSEKKIADYVKEHLDRTQYLPISELASTCNVAVATIFRFCKTLDFLGYNEFKLAVAKETQRIEGATFSTYNAITSEDSIENMCQLLFNINQIALEQTLSHIDNNAVVQAGSLLEKAGKVFCFGSGGSLITAQEAWNRFMTVSGKFFTIQDEHSQIMAASLANPNDVILYVSYSGFTREAKDILQPAKARGAKIILLTHYKDSPAAELADVVLLCGAEEAPLQSGSIAAKIGMLFLIDILVNEYCRRDIERTMQNVDLTSDALTSRHL